jgi:phosphoglycolate phosphatase
LPGPLISDLDGTIADTAPAIFHSLRVTCSELGIPLSTKQELSWSLGPPLHWCLERIGVGADMMRDAIAIFERAHTDCIDLVVPMPGADVVIPELAETGVQIGVATIKPSGIADLVLRTIGLRDYVRVLCGRNDDLDPRTKTDLVRETLSELPGASPVYIGDHDNDELAARELGIRFLRYPESSWDVVRSAMADVP